MSNHHLCTTTGLDLGLGFSHAPPVGTKNPSWPISSDPLVAVPAVAAASTSSSGGFLTLRLWESSNYDADKCVEEYSGDLCGQDQAASPHSAVSSFSNSVKRERDSGGAAGSEEFLEVEKVCSRGSCDEDEDGSNARKKLRLNKQQSALLEQNFKRHSTLNPAQKQALAKELNLRPRQVEVWFQNRRARTKLKQIEVECEYLKKCCESLTDENRKLQKEVQELKAMKAAAGAQPFYVQLPAVSNLAVCPSCERIVGESCPAKTPYFIAVPPTARFFNPNNSSAAC